MKAYNQQQGQVQAANGLGANGGVLGAMVGIYAKKKDYETRYAYQTSLMEFDHQLKERRSLTNTVHSIAATLATDAHAAQLKIADRNHEHESNLAQMKNMTSGLNSGEISPLVESPKGFQGQLQAVGPELDDLRERLGGTSAGRVRQGRAAGAETPKAETPKAETPTAGITLPAASAERGPGEGKGRTKKLLTEEFAKPKTSAAPVNASVANPFGNSDENNTPDVEAPNAPKVTPAKVNKTRAPRVPKVANS